MGIISLIIGCFSLLGMAIGFIPLLGWFNWFNIPFALIGLAFGVAAVAQPKGSRLGRTGAILCGFAVIVGIFRLGIGCGII
ncbi:MAG: hypothetical protein V3T68_00365 [Dehalococcoidales bacterium]